MARTVWILGAGFSRPLGGPLLGQLLTPASQMQIRGAFPKQDASYRRLYDDPADLVRALYTAHGPHAALPAKHWDDAEAFLEALDAAANGTPGTPSVSVVNTLLKVMRISGDLPPISSIASAARRLLAAECSAFLKDSDPKTETWGPYTRWARSLTAGDAVVSFNYDRVVETARDAASGGKIVEVVPPGRTADSDDVPLLKLHGSVDWRLTSNGLEKTEHPDFGLTCADDELVIASPGPTKQRVTREVLSKLWDEALIRIRHAEVVVFVGYRFPPSDSQARRRLIGALIENESPHLVLRTVLGPDTTNRDTLRLKGLLEYAMTAARRAPFNGPGERKYAVRVHPMGAEDFLDLFEQGHLNQPNF
jgi:hypothetical protein